jgi:outer membrane protein assembly factor BamD
MNSKMNLQFMRIFPIFMLFIVLVSCSNYTKVLKSDDYESKFDTANQLYDNQKYDRCIGLYEQVYQRFPKQAEGEVSYFRIGKSYYLGGDFYMGGYFLGEFTSRFPFSPKVEEATFLSAMCSVNNSPEASLDQTATEVGINELQQFVDRFPDSELVDSCNNIMDRLQFKLETKKYDAVKLYSKTENFRAAVTSSEEFIKSYPISIYKEEVAYLLVNNSYLLAKNSISTKKIERTVQTLERYRNFVTEFPNSDYRRAVILISDMMEKEKQKLESKEKI